MAEARAPSIRLVNYLPKLLHVSQDPGGLVETVGPYKMLDVKIEKGAKRFLIHTGGTLLTKLRLPPIESVTCPNSAFRMLHLFKPMKANFRKDSNQNFGHPIYNIPNIRVSNMFETQLGLNDNIIVQRGGVYVYTGPRGNGMPLGTQILTSLGQRITLSRETTDLMLGMCIYSRLGEEPAESIVTSMYKGY